MQDILKSIKAFLYDRAVSPLIGAFVTAWLVWNYRVVFYLFDGKSLITEKIAFLDSYFGDEHQFQFSGYTFHVIGGGHLIHGLLMPSILTWIYIYLYPKVAIPVYKHSLNKNKELRIAKQEVENTRLLTEEESRKLQKEIEQLRYKADEEADRSAKRIASLVETINQLESKLNSSDGNDKNSTNARNLISREEQNGDSNEKLDSNVTGHLSDERFRYQNRIIEKFPIEKFVPGAFKDDDQRIELLKKIADYFFDNHINEDGLNLLCEMVVHNGWSSRVNLASSDYCEQYNSIELDHHLAYLQNLRFITVSADKIFSKLTEQGRGLVVSSGLNELGKLLG